MRAPFAFGPNDQTLLDQTDLVFIDMVGAGFSRPLGETPGSTFWGVDGDADAFTRAIMRYTTKFSRWSSPKYIIGESFGTTRAAYLAEELSTGDVDIALNGLLGMILAIPLSAFFVTFWRLAKAKYIPLLLGSDEKQEDLDS